MVFSFINVKNIKLTKKNTSGRWQGAGVEINETGDAAEQLGSSISLFSAKFNANPTYHVMVEEI